jgi:dTMP kinase
MRWPGKFIVLEGIDGSGTTTHSFLLEEHFSHISLPVHRTQEPSDGPVGRMIRLALTHRLGKAGSDGAFQPLDETTMALAFAADRADHLQCEILPCLEAGINIICDRYYLSSLAYQGPALDYAWVRQINARFPKPDLTILLDITTDLWVKRMSQARRVAQLYEHMERQEVVRDGYHRSMAMLLAEGERIIVVDTNRPEKRVHKDIVHLLDEHILSEGGR